VSELNLHDLGDQPAPDSPGRPDDGKGREKENRERHPKIRSISDLGLCAIFNLPSAFAASSLSSTPRNLTSPLANPLQDSLVLPEHGQEDTATCASGLWLEQRNRKHELQELGTPPHTQFQPVHRWRAVQDGTNSFVLGSSGFEFDTLR